MKKKTVKKKAPKYDVWNGVPVWRGKKKRDFPGLVFILLILTGLFAIFMAYHFCK